MNLFEKLYSQCANKSLENIQENLYYYIPYSLKKIQKQVKNNEQKNSLEEIYFQALNNKEYFCQNPEIYIELHKINTFLDKKEEDALINHSINLLKVHLSIYDFSNFFAINKTFLNTYRFFNPNPSIILKNKNKVSVLNENSNILINNAYDRIIIKPINGLFLDIIPRELYPNFKNIYNASERQYHIDDSFKLIKNYSESIFNDSLNCINKIFLTPSLGKGQRLSYNLRLSYLGAIFIDFLRTNKYSFAESYIHEYYHQRIWLWWYFEKPFEIPDDNYKIISPITGLPKSISVMIHALIIYISICDFYKYIEKNEAFDDPKELNFVKEKINCLEKGIPKLFVSLNLFFKGNSKAKEFLNIVYKFKI